jgi:hypothetical protein
MTSHSSAVGALDAVGSIIRRQAERDPSFAAEMVKSLSIPVEVQIAEPADLLAAMPFLDPIVVAGKGLDDFRQTFAPLKDAQLKKIIKAYNLASADRYTGKGAPKGGDLVNLMWDAARSQRARLQERS